MMTLPLTGACSRSRASITTPCDCAADDGLCVGCGCCAGSLAQCGIDWRSSPRV